MECSGSLLLLTSLSGDTTFAYFDILSYVFSYLSICIGMCRIYLVSGDPKLSGPCE